MTALPATTENNHSTNSATTEAARGQNQHADQRQSSLRRHARLIAFTTLAAVMHYSLGRQGMKSSTPSSNQNAQKGCTHLVVGLPKTATTPLSRALCHQLSKQLGEGGCVHELIHATRIYRSRPDLTPPMLNTAGDFLLCKEMVYEGWGKTTSQEYHETLGSKMLASENPIIFTKKDPELTLLGNLGQLLKGRVENLHQEFSLSNQAGIDRFTQEFLEPNMQFVNYMLTWSDVYKNFISAKGKEYIDIDIDKLTANPLTELNKALSGWGLNPLSGNQNSLPLATVAAPHQYYRSAENAAGTYQMLHIDRWETTKGETFEANHIGKSKEEIIDRLVGQFPKEASRPLLKAAFMNTCEKLAQTVAEREKTKALAEGKTEL